MALKISIIDMVAAAALPSTPDLIAAYADAIEAIEPPAPGGLGEELPAEDPAADHAGLEVVAAHDEWLGSAAATTIADREGLHDCLIEWARYRIGDAYDAGMSDADVVLMAVESHLVRELDRWRRNATLATLEPWTSLSQ